MALRIVRPPRLAPEIPLEVGLFVTGEVDRFDLALEGKTPDYDEAVALLNDELDRIEADGIEAGEEEERAAVLTCASSMILRGMGAHLANLDEIEPEEPGERLRLGELSLMYASLIRTGIKVADWSDKWAGSPAGPMPWPSDAHMVSSAIAFSLSTQLGSDEALLSFADDIEAQADDLLAA